MTRINIVDPKELHNLHLGGEYYELPRVFKLARKAVDRGEDPLNPRYHNGYVRGKGHVLFFYPRLQYLAIRQQRIVREMIRRGFTPNFTDPYDLSGFPPEWRRDWKPSPAAISLNRRWLAEKKRDNPAVYERD